MLYLELVQVVVIPYATVVLSRVHNTYWVTGIMGVSDIRTTSTRSDITAFFYQNSWTQVHRLARKSRLATDCISHDMVISDCRGSHAPDKCSGEIMEIYLFVCQLLTRITTLRLSLLEDLSRMPRRFIVEMFSLMCQSSPRKRGSYT